MAISNRIRLGLAIELTGRPGWRVEPPDYGFVREQARTAERVGFDLVVVEDALSFPFDDITVGAWESVVVLGALAEATSTIRLGHSVINTPYRAPGHLAKIAETLDEVSGGRYELGVGAGNTPDADYRAFGIPAAPRYSRFVECLEIVHQMLHTGRADFDGRHHVAEGAELVLRGPRPAGPPIVVGAGGPKMMRAAARFGDGWNWWANPHTTPAHIAPLVDELTRACVEVGRDPDSIRRSLDLYFPVAPPGWDVEHDGAAPQASDDETVDALLAYATLGISEIRCYLPRPVSPSERLRSIEEMSGIVERVHAFDG